MTFRALCEETLPLDLPRLLFVHEKQTFGVLTTLALQELPADFIDLDEVGPFLVCRIGAHASAFDKRPRLSITHRVRVAVRGMIDVEGE
jgi:hypothetical protein